MSLDSVSNQGVAASTSASLKVNDEVRIAGLGDGFYYLPGFERMREKFSERYRHLLRDGLAESDRNNCLGLLWDYKTARNFATDGLPTKLFMHSFAAVIGSAWGGMVGVMMEVMMGGMNDKIIHSEVIGVGGITGAAIALGVYHLFSSHQVSQAPVLRNALLGECMDESALASFDAPESKSADKAQFSGIAPFQNPLAGHYKPLEIPAISAREVAEMRAENSREPSTARTLGEIGAGLLALGISASSAASRLGTAIASYGLSLKYNRAESGEDHWL